MDLPRDCRILITGGTGFIGRHLVRKMLAQRFTLRLLVRSIPKATQLFGNQGDYHLGSLEKANEIDQAVAGCDAVIHLGGLYRFGRTNQKKLFETNLLGTENLLKAAQKHSIKRFLFIGTAGVLKSDRPLISENDFPPHSPWGTPYKKSKWEAESKVLQAIQNGFPALIASPTCPIGDEDEAPTPTGGMIVDFLNHDFPFYTHSGINLIDIDDLVEGIIATFSRGKIGKRYLLAGENLWLREFLQLLSQATGIPTPRYAIPSPLLLLAALFMEVAMLFGKKTARLNLETALHAGKIQFYDAQKTYLELGWRPSFDTPQAIQKAIQSIHSRNRFLLDLAPPSPIKILS